MEDPALHWSRLSMSRMYWVRHVPLTVCRRLIDSRNGVWINTIECSLPVIGDYPSNSSSYSEHLLPRALNAGPNYPCTLNLIAVMGIHIYYSWLLSDFETFFYHNDSNGFVFVFSPDLFSYWLRSENGMAEANLTRVSHHVFVVIAILFAPQFARVASQFIIACVWSK